MWQVEISDTAARQLTKLGKLEAARITAFLRERIAGSENPRAVGKALTGPLGGLWRYRVGDYRVICSLEDAVLRVLVLRVGHRGGVYR
jgi:mRNA interferase RelE/StbE